MLVNSPMILRPSVRGPAIVQVTRVPSPSGANVNVATDEDLSGLRKSRATTTRVGSSVSVIFIRPWPALRFPDQAYVDPTPFTGPPKVRRIAGSSPSHGDHAGQRWKSSTCSNSRPGGAWTVVDRCTV